MTVVDVQIQLFQTHWKQMHNITNIQIENLVVLLFDTKDSFNIVLKFDIPTFNF